MLGIAWEIHLRGVPLSAVPKTVVDKIANERKVPQHALIHGVTIPEGLDIGGARTEHALVVGLGVTLSGQGTMPALRVVKKQVLRTGPLPVSVAHVHFHKHPSKCSCKMCIKVKDEMRRAS